MKRLWCVLLAIFLLLGLVAPAAATPGERVEASYDLWVLDGAADDWQGIEGVEIVVRVNGTPTQTLVTGENGNAWGYHFVSWGDVDFAQSTVRQIITVQIISAPGFCLAGENGREIRLDEFDIWTKDGVDGLSALHSWTLYPLAPPAPPPPPIVGNFADIREGAWYVDSVRFVYDNGIMTGTTPTTFSPGQNFTREQLTATLFRILHGRTANAGDSRDNPFTDVPVGHWSAPYVTWALNAGIVTGTSPTSFAPGNPILRQDFALMLYRFAPHVNVGTGAAGSNLDFPDAHTVGPWAQDAVLWAVHHGLLRGIGGNLVPQGTTDRAQGATLLQRFEQDMR